MYSIAAFPGSEETASIFGDKRIDARLKQLHADIESHESVNVKQISDERSKQKAYYRILSNSKVSEGKMIEALTSHCGAQVAGREVLVISDTSEINLQKHSGRLEKCAQNGVGVVGNNSDAGFFIHPGIVIDRCHGHILGLSSLQIWTREEGRPGKKGRQYSQLPIEAKESNRWIIGCQESEKCLEQASHLTFVQDREGDIFQQFAAIPNNQCDLVIRSRGDRRLADGGKLYEGLATAPLAGSYQLQVNGDKRISRSAREATIEVRYIPICIQKPANLKDENLPKSLALYAVEAREVNGSGKPILWRILTTRRLACYQEAKEVVDIYKQRWNVEEVFRLLKRKGFGIEESQLESGWGIRKLTVLALDSSIKVMQLKLARDNPQSQPLSEVFTEEEVEVLQYLNKKLEGKTQLLKNKFDPQTLAWATWIMGRLSGWGGFPAERKPGVISLKNGLNKFRQLCIGFYLAKDVGTQ